MTGDSMKRICTRLRITCGRFIISDFVHLTAVTAIGTNATESISDAFLTGHRVTTRTDISGCYEVDESHGRNYAPEIWKKMIAKPIRAGVARRSHFSPRQ